ncbi:response regulator transcription factor [Paenibacillus thermotolerans]|uniref:response regulator transcription factor n=1 Tax=Paenibacillus thermotolerans TaxID=3027807 RepID=UPI0023682AE3|nr:MULTISPECIES: response regulator transcription factor [unclassified Paenibacillus]
MENKRILIVEDEQTISMLLEYNLKAAGFQVHCVYDGEAVFECMQTFSPELIVLDVMLPKLDGFQVCRSLRNAGNMVPIIMLTALQDVTDKIAGLDNGADDYVTKPFSPQELISRIHAILRRSSSAPEIVPERMIRFGELTIIPDQREILLRGEAVELTPKEFDLLLYMHKNKGKVLSRQQLLRGVWDYHFLGETRIVDVHISHLRDKIEREARNPEYIVTVRNVGYKLTEPKPREEAR